MSEKALLPSRTQFAFSMKQPIEDSDESDKESVCVSSYFDDKDGKCYSILCCFFHLLPYPKTLVVTSNHNYFCALLAAPPPVGILSSRSTATLKNLIF